MVRVNVQAVARAGSCTELEKGYSFGRRIQRTDLPGLGLIEPDKAVAIYRDASNEGSIAGCGRNSCCRAKTACHRVDSIYMSSRIIFADCIRTLLAEPEISGAVAINQMRDVVDSDFGRGDSAS